MKKISSPLQQHLNSGSTTYVYCWKVIPRPPATVIGFTEHTENLMINGLNYLARSGFSPSALRNTSDLTVDNFEVTFLLEFDGTHEADLIAGLYDYAQVEVFLVNYADVNMGKVTLAKGTLGEITIGRNEAKAEIRGLMQELQQNVLELTSPSCRANLGDLRCKVNLANYTIQGSVTDVSSNKKFTDKNCNQPDGDFNGGVLTWLTGNNSGLKMEVRQYHAKQFELYQNASKPIQKSDTYSIVRGCDKLLSTCKNVFNNVIHFRGEPHLPGSDQMLKMGGQ